MPWSGGAFTRTNGVHTGATLWAQDRDAGTKILAARHDTHDQDLATGINSTLEKSGSNAATGNLNIGSNRLTAVADGTAKTDAATVNQIQSNAPAFQASDTGTANAHAIALSPAITAYAAGQAITFKSASTSTTASTLNVNGLGTKALKKKNDQAIAAGDIESGSIVTAVYDGTNFQVTSQLGSEASAGGSNTQVQYNSSGSLAGDADLTFDGTNLTVANPLYLPDGAVATPSLANTGDLNTGVYFPAADTVGVVAGGKEKWRFGNSPLAGKNYVVNGAFQVDQRSSDTRTGLGGALARLADQWVLRWDGATGGRYTYSTEDNGGVNSESKWAKFLTTTADAAGTAGDYQYFYTPIEAQNLQGLIAANGKLGDTTQSMDIIVHADGASGISFPCKVGCWIHTQDGTARQWVQDVTITSADTWQRVSISRTADSVATIDQNSDSGIWMGFCIATGTDRQVTGGAWENSGGDIGTSNSINIGDATNNYIGFANVTLEAGLLSTAAEVQDYGTTLARARRYYFRNSYAAGVVVANGFVTAATSAQSVLSFAEMRAAPTMSLSGVADFVIGDKDVNADTTGFSFDSIGTSTAKMMPVASGGGLGAGEGCIIKADGSGTRFIDGSAEL